MKFFRLSLLFISLLFVGCSTPTYFREGIPNFAKVKDNVYRGGQPPDKIGWDNLKRLGVKYVIKLNMESEGSDDYAEKIGMIVIRIPITTIEQTIGKPPKEKIDFALKSIDKDGTFIHCTHGEDRTMLVVGIWLVEYFGLPKDMVYRQMDSAGFHPLLRGLYWYWEENVIENIRK